MSRPNNEQIDNTSYYRLPCGRYLEDYIWRHGYSFFHGQAMKYLYRAGRKDGESAEKDRAKAAHYIRYMAERTDDSYVDVESDVLADIEAARNWNGKD